MNKEEAEHNFISGIPHSKMMRFKQRLQDHATEAELRFKGFLKEFGIPFYFQRGVYVDKDRGRFRIVDFYVARVKIIFEIDGEYHNNLLQHGRDVLREEQIKERKRNVLFVRFTNKEILENPELVKQRVKEIYNEKLTRYYSKKRRFSKRTKSRYQIL